ncbi:MAG: 2-hydroxyacid dehydrogenase [Alphaproteobacteria bacterium]
MAMVLIGASQDAGEWRALMGRLLPGVDFRVWPEVGDPADIEMAIAWKAPLGALKSLPNLRLVCSLGQGVDHLFAHGDLPAGVAVVRLVDESMRRQMTAYVLAAVLGRLCRMEDYARLQAGRRWRALEPHDPAATRVGVMGLGALGGDVAEKLVALGFRVSGWSRCLKRIDGVDGFAGRETLAEFLGPCDIVCCLLPLTAETRDVLDARAFAAMKPGAYLINAARGHHVVETDLIAALDDGRLAGATLDVFRTEPLPADSPLWTHPKVTVTPHASSVTLARSCAGQIAENYRRLHDGRPLLNPVDPARQY